MTTNVNTVVNNEKQYVTWQGQGMTMEHGKHGTGLGLRQTETTGSKHNMPTGNLCSKPDLFAVVLRVRIISCHSNKLAVFRIGNFACSEG